MKTICAMVLSAAMLSGCLALHISDAAAKDACTQAQDVIAQQIPKDSRSGISAALDGETRRFQPRGLSEAFCRELLGDLSDKIESSRRGLRLTPEIILRRGILFESFRLETYLSSGVSAKRYFGFFDEQGDTAAYERSLRTTVIKSVKIANDFAAGNGLNFGITEEEAALTFLAEGGALLLTNPESTPNRVHPVRGIGLDDFRTGFAHFPGLVERFDREFGTKLGSLVLRLDSSEVLLRPMTFREAILGTTLMYLYEKELTAKMAAAEWKMELKSLPLPRQFITTSLVYNSGLLFSYERVRQIENFATGDYLAEVNEKSNRPKLSVYPRAESEERLKQGEGIPRQLTSWSAVYHILQRYGAWVAVEKFSETFKDGAFINRD